MAETFYSQACTANHVLGQLGSFESYGWWFGHFQDAQCPTAGCCGGASTHRSRNAERQGTDSAQFGQVEIEDCIAMYMIDLELMIGDIGRYRKFFAVV